MVEDGENEFDEKCRRINRFLLPITVLSVCAAAGLYFFLLYRDASMTREFIEAHHMSPAAYVKKVERDKLEYDDEIRKQCTSWNQDPFNFVAPYWIGIDFLYESDVRISKIQKQQICKKWRGEDGPTECITEELFAQAKQVGLIAEEL